MNKRIVCLAVTACLISGAASAAEEDTIIKTAEFQSETNQYSYSFEEKTEENGKEYSLSDVKYEVISTEEKTTDTELTKEFVWNGLESQSYEFPSDTDITNENGETVSCKLDSVSWENAPVTGRTRKATKQIESGYEFSVPDFPSTTAVTFTDSATGESLTASLSFVNTEILEAPAWKEDVEISMTVSDYESELYYLDENTAMPFDDEAPVIDGIEKDLLKALNLDENRYKLISAEWVGEPYEDNDTICRNAVLKGARLVGKWVANYSSDVPLPDIDGYNAVTIYKGNSTEKTGEIYTVKATAVYNAEAVPLIETDTEDGNEKSLIPVMAIGGSSIVVVAVAAIFFLISSNEVIVYDTLGKRLFSAKMKKQKDKCTVDISKINKYGISVFDCKVKKSAQNRLRNRKLLFMCNGKSMDYITVGNCYRVEKTIQEDKKAAAVN